MDTAAAGSSSRINRTTVERERRMRLRDLYSHLSSLLPSQPTKLRKLYKIHVDSRSVRAGHRLCKPAGNPSGRTQANEVANRRGGGIRSSNYATLYKFSWKKEQKL
ncbi:hypothetical protein CRYUN_Cryun21dG0069300 [Craigia yunnanensis]